LKRAAALPPLPEKHFFKIGEVADLVGVRTSVLRFWESEFTQIRPEKSPNGHRVYARADVELLRRIRLLVHDRGYTIAGARTLLAQGESAVQAVLDANPSEAAAARDDATARLDAAGVELDGLRGRVARLEKQLRSASEEAFFWRRRAMAEEKRLRDLTAALRGVLGGLKSMTVQKIEKDSG
jgi:DNA-binding transcriptional MerR regulator